MPPVKRYVLLSSLLAVIGVAVALASGDFHGCPPDGTGQRRDPDLNELKNRDTAPDHYQTMSVADFIGNEAPEATAMGKKDRTDWTDDAKSEVTDWEGKGATVTGRLIALRSQGPESCNCGSGTYVDTHMWLATRASADAKSTQSMVVEISPREIADHPGWAHSKLVELSKHGTKVRISGWIMWDEEHGSEVGKSRGTLWEIHPIHRIEVFEGGEWKDLDQE